MNVNTKKTLTYLSLFVFILPVLESQAEIFKCTSNDKSIYYNDKPCPVVDVEKKMNHVKDIDKGYVPDSVLKKDERDQSKEILNEDGLEITTSGSDKKPKNLTDSQRKNSLSNNNTNSNIKKNSFEENIPAKDLMDDQNAPIASKQNVTPAASTQTQTQTQTVKEAKTNQLKNIKTY